MSKEQVDYLSHTFVHKPIFIIDDCMHTDTLVNNLIKPHINVFFSSATKFADIFNDFHFAFLFDPKTISIVRININKTSIKDQYYNCVCECSDFDFLIVFEKVIDYPVMELLKDKQMPILSTNYHTFMWFNELFPYFNVENYTRDYFLLYCINIHRSSATSDDVYMITKELYSKLKTKSILDINMARMFCMRPFEHILKLRIDGIVNCTLYDIIYGYCMNKKDSLPIKTNEGLEMSEEEEDEHMYKLLQYCKYYTSSTLLKTFAVTNYVKSLDLVLNHLKKISNQDLKDIFLKSIEFMSIDVAYYMMSKYSSKINLKTTDNVNMDNIYNMCYVDKEFTELFLEFYDINSKDKWSIIQYIVVHKSIDSIHKLLSKNELTENDRYNIYIKVLNNGYFSNDCTLFQAFEKYPDVIVKYIKSTKSLVKCLKLHNVKFIAQLFNEKMLVLTPMIAYNHLSVIQYLNEELLTQCICGTNIIVKKFAFDSYIQISANKGKVLRTLKKYYKFCNSYELTQLINFNYDISVLNFTDVVKANPMNVKFIDKWPKGTKLKISKLIHLKDNDLLHILKTLNYKLTCTEAALILSTLKLVNKVFIKTIIDMCPNFIMDNRCKLFRNIVMYEKTDQIFELIGLFPDHNFTISNKDFCLLVKYGSNQNVRTLFENKIINEQHVDYYMKKKKNKRLPLLNLAKNFIPRIEYPTIKFPVIQPYYVYIKKHDTTDNKLCGVCMNENDDLMMNCGHTLCSKCVNSINSCPFCRANILFIVLLPSDIQV